MLGRSNIAGDVFWILPNCEATSAVLSYLLGSISSPLVLCNTTNPTPNTNRANPWRYSAKQLFKLTPNCLTITLIVKNNSELILPFGCGFHPWFPRSDNTRLSFAAEKVWMVNEDHLPTKEVLLVDDSSWSFKDHRKLPVNFINNGYTGWDGTTFIEKGEESISCKITASNILQTAIIYSPNDKSDFFCFEPVSHPVDAFNLPGRPGLEELVSGHSMIASMSIMWK